MRQFPYVSNLYLDIQLRSIRKHEILRKKSAFFTSYPKQAQEKSFIREYWKDELVKKLPVF